MALAEAAAHVVQLYSNAEHILSLIVILARSNNTSGSYQAWVAFSQKMFVTEERSCNNPPSPRDRPVRSLPYPMQKPVTEALNKVGKGVL